MTAVQESIVALENVLMTPVLWSDVHLAEAVSWFGVASHQLDEHLLWSLMAI